MSKLIARLSALVEEARGLSVELNELAELDELSEEQEVRFAELAADEGPIEALVAEKADIEKRLAILEAASNVANTEIGEDRSVPHFMKQTSREVDLRTASRGEVRSAAMAILEREAKDQVVPVSDETATQVARLIAQRTMNTDGDVIARRLILTESDAYRSLLSSR
jgi:hypothetical protein